MHAISCRMRAIHPLNKLLGLSLIAVLAGSACGDDPREVVIMYDQSTARVLLQFENQSLSDSEKVYIRTRRGKYDQLDCSKLSTEIQASADLSDNVLYGPVVDSALTDQFYDNPLWAVEPTPEMLAQIPLGTDSIIDVCIMDGTKITFQKEMDLFAAWDNARNEGVGGKADDPSGEVAINSVTKYAERCVAELGEIPFFKKLADGKYETYDCLNSTPIPMTVTENGTTNNPQQTVDKCDNPQYIYSLCEAGPRVASRINDEGTRWVLLCRKSIGGYTSNKYNDIAMVGNNPFTGKTCFFQNALYNKTDGGKIPHPGDLTQSANLWQGVQGGVGGTNNIECQQCHAAKAFIHSPWIDGAKDAQGRSIVPKIGEDPDYPTGANDVPYSLVNFKGQGWQIPTQATGPKVAACTQCHRVAGKGTWVSSYYDRMDGSDSTWNNVVTDEYLKASHKFWMPTNATFATDADFAASSYGQALKVLQNCNSNAADCGLKPVPTTLGGDVEVGAKLRNKVTMSDSDLAQKSVELLGFGRGVPAAESRCGSCHTATRHTLNDWKAYTQKTDTTCLANPDDAGVAKTDTKTNYGLTKNQLRQIASYTIAAGSTITVKMTGTADADLYVRKDAKPTRSLYDCRPFVAGTANETCDSSNLTVTGPGTFYIAAYTKVSKPKVNVTVTYTAPGANAMDPLDRIACFKKDQVTGEVRPSYFPQNVGIYAAGAHLGYFVNLFKAAFPEGQNGNTSQTWALEYGKFKARVGMPKGDHPQLSRQEFDIVAEWYARGLPLLTTYMPEDPPPSVCTPNVSAGMIAHINDMATRGWEQVNKDRGLAMFGCNGSNDPRQCLTSFPEASSKSYGSSWSAMPAAKLRVLRELSFSTYYWMRSAADGRFVANGASGTSLGAMITDLQTGKDIPTHAAYDPGFYPDNSGFMFQNTPIGTGFCNTSLLTSGPAKIEFNEAQCRSATGIPLYQHMGAALNGGDYFTINGSFTSDNPSTQTADPRTGFSGSAQITLTPLTFNGTHYATKRPTSVAAPFQGDAVTSPSTELVATRIAGPNGQQLGYALSKINATPNGDSYDITTTEVARYCTSGSKVAISFDERFMVYHHYIGDADAVKLGFSSAADPGFAEYKSKGGANIIVMDLKTGAETRVTNVKPGQYALFPHFRSDGWIYFQVRDHNTRKEYVLASDAAVTLR